MPKKNKPKKNKRRNLAALSPLMRKGGAHIRSASSKRRKQKNKLRKELDRLAEQGDFFMSAFIFQMYNSCSFTRY